MQALQHRSTRGGGAGPTASGLALETGTIKGNVPQFLAKLWNMVNDPATDHLIKWADDGTSFYILDQDRFSKEILGNFYKTENVQSFVRQLNMYGFHKIQHIRQGAMRSSKESQAWQFTNPNFQRGQADLLCLIARKHKHPEKGNALIVSSTGATIEPIEGPDGERDQLANGELAMAGKGNGQLDVHGIINGLAAIKRHQSVISATLKEVQQSNSALWQEAMEARERHRKHQDTINRILKFLASLYQHPSGSPGGAVGVTGGAANDVIPRPRLMITDSTGASKSTKQEDSTPMTANGNGVRLEEIELLDDIPASSTPLAYPGLSPTVETPGPLSSFIESVSTPASMPNKNTSAPTSCSATNGQQSQYNATSSTGASANTRPTANPDAWNPAWNSALIQNLLQMNPQLWNGVPNKGFQLPFTPQPQPDNSMALTQMTQPQTNMPVTASTIQQLLQGLGPYLPAATPSNSNLNTLNNQQLVNGNAFNNLFDPTALSAAMASTNPQPAISNLSDLILPPSNDAQLQGLMQSSQQLNAINEGVAHVDEHINNLINSMPVDPAVASSFRAEPSVEMASMPVATSGDVNGIQEAIDDEMDLEALWRQLGFEPGFGMAGTNLPASTTTDADIDPALFLESLPQPLLPQGALPPGGFLDEVTTSPLLPSNASDIIMADSLAPPDVAGSTLGGARATRKRKSDVADLSPTATSGTKTTGSRTKRKR